MVVEIEELNISNYKPINFKPTKFKISTISAICNMNISYVNLNELSKYICPKCRTLLENKNNYHICKVKKKAKLFYNQITMLVAIGKDRKINVKIFKNGACQLTGLKSEKEGHDTIKILIDILYYNRIKVLTFYRMSINCVHP